LADQTQFGVTPDGFVLKGIDRIIADQQARARTMFGDDVDLGSGSALRKVLDGVAWSAQELWRGLERQYYGNFVTTAQGPSLDLLGTDLGIPRRNLQATGQVTLTLASGAPGRQYVLPEGLVLQTTAPPLVSFRTAAPVTLTSVQPVATVGVQAAVRGPAGNLPPNSTLKLDPAWAKLHLNLGPATATPANALAFAGGELMEADADYRARLLGVPRTIWTPDAVLAAVLSLDGVRDAAVFDPLGGVDVSQSYFNMFLFNQRAFSMERQIGSPYYFDIVVATEPGWPWTTGGGSIPGVYDTVLETVRQLRPASIFPNIVQANQVDVGLRATLLVQAGHDQDAVRAGLLDALHTGVNTLRMGRGVLFSDVMLLARTTPGVVDVQRLHLRRCPPAFAGINFGGARFGQSVELAMGENLVLSPDEVALFTLDSQLSDIQVIGQ
jgi:hypothetical protein